MGAPSNIDITNDNQSDLLKDLVDMIDEDGSIDKWLDAIIRQSSGTECDTDNGQDWWSPVNRPVEQGDHADRLRQPTIRPPGNVPREEAGVHAQDNSREQNFPHCFMIQPVGYEPEINCLTRDPVPTRASRGRDRVQLQNKPSGKPASEGKVTPSKEPTLPHHKPVLKWVKTEAEPAQLSCASAVSPPIPVFPSKFRFPPANHRVEFPQWQNSLIDMVNTAICQKFRIPQMWMKQEGLKRSVQQKLS
ncbi:uncharacterized protein LOC115727710 [Rhodamnia argentea]|uniref:Uncharacterized protein LOC115727710 n=1 Tax=Rhodamnia argentea TaxID=178133 RepID=A0A8B8MUR3_9MYRT|nr:uncharacterized protein LOC115727710 [Rhodamnia argentea]